MFVYQGVFTFGEPFLLGALCARLRLEHCLHFDKLRLWQSKTTHTHTHTLYKLSIGFAAASKWVPYKLATPRLG